MTFETIANANPQIYKVALYSELVLLFASGQFSEYFF